MSELIPVEKLVDGASYLFGMLPEVITGRSRTQRIFRARSAVALAARVGGYSYPAIGALLDRDHKVVMNACDRAEEFYRLDPTFKRKCDMLIGMARNFQEACNDNEPKAGNGSAPTANERAAII